ncbi:hypothetical protein J2R76_000005 [Bradyrhizobium sp. USDA 4532]|nr:hypothetical protein [Bradyrhizobium sp. USDA 4545]MCP1916414.1 hypothetical protein [Bradyrhizobium sp. USDA 4532]
MRIIRTICWICAFLGLLHVGLPARAQTNDQGPQTPSNAPAPVPEQPALKPAELEALVAPIALYPDTLMSNVLMASTYPLEVVHADRWMKQNKNLKGDALKAARRISACLLFPARPQVSVVWWLGRVRRRAAEHWRAAAPKTAPTVGCSKRGFAGPKLASGSGLDCRTNRQPQL